MLNEGIYEQIVSERIGRELAELDPTVYEISRDELRADDARSLLTIYLSSVIQKGLKFVRDQYKSDQDEAALLAQIRLCNDIVEEIASHTNDSDGEAYFRDNEILEKGEVLTSIYQKINSMRSLKKLDVVRPETSIVENALFTGSPSEPSMLSELQREIASSDRIDLLVSFIKWSAIRPLMSSLQQFTERPNTKLRIATTTYTKATDYGAVLTLARLNHTEVKVNYETSHARMHAKSYLFNRDTGFSTAYIGSSNLSNPALTGGLEWNVKVTEKESFDIVKKFEVSFESYWNDSSFETFDPDDEACRNKLMEELDRRKDDPINNRHLHVSIKPYPYQQEILDNLDAERTIYGHNKNLVVAATGVGKTVIAAFDYKRYKDNHTHANLLFVAHREEILKQSMETFQEVLNDFNFGNLYVGGYKPSDIDHLFISIQSLNSSRLTDWTTPDYYDFIIVDEFHHAAAKSYQKLLEYYKPKVLLGLTATPERMDGKDILKYFDGRIASRMLLGEAIDRNLLSTFQYYGITDSVDYSKRKWLNGRYDASDLEHVYTADTRRCQLIMNTINKYIIDIDSVKGLGFCVTIKHAEYMAKYFNEHGVPSIALSASSESDIRKDAKKQLVDGQIKFIFVVDLYNEGVDIKEVNTILFLRPTESATVFLQQLGRGLRLADGKECLTVLDFVGQANRKYNFAAKYEALVGRGRKSLMKQLDEGFSNLPRGCYIEFEKMARDYILTNLQQTDNNKRTLTDNVRTFEEDTGKTLTLDNYLSEYDLSLYEFYQNTGDRSFYRLQYWAGIIDDDSLDDARYKEINKKFTGLFHVNSIRLLDYWISYIEEGKKPVSESERIMRNMLYYTFYRRCPEKEGFSDIDDGIQSILDTPYVKDEVLQIIKYKRAHVEFIPGQNEYEYECPLDLHCEYSTNQILAAYGYYDETNAYDFREGIKYFKDKKTDIFLINLNKSEKEFSPSTMYDDYAISSYLFHWQSQSQDKEASSKIQRYIHHKETGNTISLFVREYKKNGQYTSPYIFLGNADYVSHEGEMPVSFIWKLHEPIPAELLPKANKTIAI